jgi:hypothetical protein
MGHEIVKSELLTAEKIQEMKFNKENFNTLQELSIMQTQQISTINENLEVFQESNRQLKNEILKKESVASYVDKIIKLRNMKIEILNKRLEYLEFRRTIEVSVNDVKNAE